MAEDLPDSSSDAFTDVGVFLRHIHKDFMWCVDPSQGWLVDSLISAGALTLEDQERMNLPTLCRRDRARKLMLMMSGMSPAMFHGVVLPALREEYPHVIRGHVFRYTQPDTVQECPYHAMKRKEITPARFADIFPSLKCCTYDEYTEIANGNQHSEEMWRRVSSILRRNLNRPEVQEALTRFFINTVKIQIPADFQQRLIDGFPCNGRHADPDEQECLQNPEPLRFSPERGQRQSQDESETLNPGPRSVALPGHRQLWLPTPRSDTKSSSNDYPSTVDMDIDSACSSSSEHEDAGPEAEDADPQTSPGQSRFETRRDKDDYIRSQEKVSLAITRAAYIRPLHRELEGVQERVGCLVEAAKDEGHIQTSEDKKTITILRGRGLRLRTKQDKLYDRAFKTLNNYESLSREDLAMPVAKRNAFLTKLHMLRNEVKEAEGFLKRSRKSYAQIATYCRNLYF